MRARLRDGVCTVALFAIIAALPVASSADIAPKWSDVQLAGFSEVILTGTVASISSARDNSGAIYTYVTVDVGDVLKGWIFERQIVIKQLGGTVGDQSLVVYGQPSFAVGEETLLFLEVRPRDESLYTTALWQGKWHIEADAAGQRIATRQVPGIEDRGVFTSRDVRPLAGFLGQLRSLAGPDALRPGRFLNTRPRETPAETEQLNAAPFTLLGPARWRQADSGVAVLVDLQAGGQPGLAGGGISQLVNTATLWMSAGSSFRWAAGNTAAAPQPSETFTGSGKTLITYNDPFAEISNTGGTLAIGGFWSGAVTHTVSGTGFATISQGFLVFNDGATAQPFVTNSGCFQDIATHELGHSIGFGHSSAPSAIMFATLSFASCSSGAHSLGSDDVAVIRFVYPAAGAPPPTVPGAPTNLTATVSAGRTVTLTWGASPAVSALPSAATSYFIEAGSSPGLSNLAAFSTGSTATTFSASNVPAGTYYVRVRGENSAGRGPASNQVVVTVP